MLTDLKKLFWFTNLKRSSHKQERGVTQVEKSVAPVGAASKVGIRVDDRNTGEPSSGLEGGKVLRVTDHLGVVVHRDWRRDDVGAGREVNKRRGCS